MSKNLKKSLSYNQVTKEFKEEAIKLNSITLSDRQVSDLELILNGAFAPLNGFMNKKDYDSVLSNMRLDNGDLWPLPITLDVSKKTIELFNLKEKSKISLRDKEGFLIAIMTIMITTITAMIAITILIIITGTTTTATITTISRITTTAASSLHKRRR